MTLINHPGSHQQAALACLDSGIARDIALMLADARAVLDWLASGDAPPSAARGAAAVLADTDSPYGLPGLAGAARAVQNSGRMCGNNNTSRIDGESVYSITMRSTPRPSPAVGGIPYSSART